MRFLLCVFFLCVPWFATPLVAAESCSTVRMDEPGGAMSGLPVQDQGDVGICYAYAATALFDAWLDQYLPPPQKRNGFVSSALYASMNFTLTPENKRLRCPERTKEGNDEFKPLIAGGTTCATVNAILNKGDCPHTQVDQVLDSSPVYKMALADAIKERTKALEIMERELRAAQRAAPNLENKAKRSAVYAELAKQNRLSIESRSEQVAEQRKKIEEIRRRTPSSQLATLKAFYDDRELLAFCKEHGLLCPSPSNNNTRSAAAELLESSVSEIAKKALDEFKREIDEGACSKAGTQWQLNGCEPRCNDVTEKKFSLSIIHGLLNRPNPQPIGLGLCSAVLKSDKQHQIWKKFEHIPVPVDQNWKKNDKCGPHAVIIIGRQRSPVTGKCQLIIRNSWGAECSELGNCNDDHCRCLPGTGNTLIDEELIQANGLDLEYLERKETCRK